MLQAEPKRLTAREFERIRLVQQALAGFYRPEFRRNACLNHW
jgi:hypothetical protein